MGGRTGGVGCEGRGGGVVALVAQRFRLFVFSWLLRVYRYASALLGSRDARCIKHQISNTRYQYIVLIVRGRSAASPVDKATSLEKFAGSVDSAVHTRRSCCIFGCLGPFVGTGWRYVWPCLERGTAFFGSQNVSRRWLPFFFQSLLFQGSRFGTPLCIFTT